MKKLNPVAVAIAALASAALLSAGPAAAAPSSPTPGIIATPHARPSGGYAVISNHTDHPHQIFLTRLHDDASVQDSPAAHALPRMRIVPGGEWHFNHPHPRLGRPH